MIVNLTGETADVVVPDADLEDSRRAQIEDIVKRKTGIAAENIVITPLNGSSEEISEEAGEAENESEETAASSMEEPMIETEGIYD